MYLIGYKIFIFQQTVYTPCLPDEKQKADEYVKKAGKADPKKRIFCLDTKWLYIPLLSFQGFMEYRTKQAGKIPAHEGGFRCAQKKV